MNRRGTNFIEDFKLILHYKKMLKDISPDAVFTYTIKPNVYGGIACQLTKIPYFTNITGLGTSVENVGLLQKISLLLYKIGLRKSKCVFFQNDTNLNFMKQRKIYLGKTILLPGSGVNLEMNRFRKYPEDGKIGRAHV